MWLETPQYNMKYEYYEYEYINIIWNAILSQISALEKF